MVGGNEGELFHSFAGESIWNMGNTDGAECRDKGHTAKIEDMFRMKYWWGAPEINALWATIESSIGGGSIIDVHIELGEGGVVSEVPMPTYGYMRRDSSYRATTDGNLIDDWAIGAVKGLVYTDRKGWGAWGESPICQIPWGNTEHPCARRRRMRFTRWVRYKERQ